MLSLLVWCILWTDWHIHNLQWI